MEKTEKAPKTHQNEESRYCNLRVSKETFTALTSILFTSPCFPCEEKQEKKQKND